MAPLLPRARRSPAAVLTGGAAPLLALALLCGALHLFGLGRPAVWEIDEARHVQVAGEMAAHGEGFHPTEFGRPYFNKPGLPTWLNVLALRTLGGSLLAVRLWAALFAIAAVLATFALGRRIGGPGVGWLGALGLCTATLFVHRHCGRTAQFDSLMVLCFVLATHLFLRAMQTGRGWLWCAAVAAMASQAKNFAGLVPAAVFALTLLLARPAHRPKGRTWLLGGALFLAINLAYIVPMLAIHGEAFWHQFFERQVLERPDVPQALSIAGALGRYLEQLSMSFFPFGLLALAGLIAVAREAVTTREPAATLLAFWVLVLVLVCVLLLRRAWEWYLIPLLPFLAIAGARYLVEASHRGKALVVGAIALAALLWMPRPESHPYETWNDALPELAWASGSHLVLVPVAAVLAALIWRRRAPRAPWAQGLSVIAAAMLVSAAAVAVVQPLARLDDDNALTRTRRALLADQNGRPAALFISSPFPRRGTLLRFYFGALPGLQTRFLRDQPARALAQAAAHGRASYALLLEPVVPGRAAPAATGQARVVFEADLPDRYGVTKWKVRLLMPSRNASTRVRSASTSAVL